MSTDLPCIKSEEFKLDKLLLVEGRDEVKLFSALLNHLGMRGIQIKDLSGKYSLPTKIKAVVQTPGFGQVISMGIVRDADKSAKDTFNSVKGALEANQLPLPKDVLEVASGKPTVVVLIVPHRASIGMLEDVCLQSVSQDPAMECLNSYFECLQNKLTQMPTNIAKARSHAFLASRLESDLRVGEAALKGYWNFDTTAFDTVKQFLKKL